MISAVDRGAAIALVGLSKSLRFLTADRFYRWSGWYTGRTLDSTRRGAEEQLAGFLRGVEKLDLSVDPAIDALRKNVAHAYRASRPRRRVRDSLSLSGRLGRHSPTPIRVCVTP